MSLFFFYVEKYLNTSRVDLDLNKKKKKNKNFHVDKIERNQNFDGIGYRTYNALLVRSIK